MDDDKVRLSFGPKGPGHKPDFEGVYHWFFYSMTNCQHSTFSLCGEVQADDYHINMQALMKCMIIDVIRIASVNHCKRCERIAKIVSLSPLKIKSLKTEDDIKCN